MIAAAIVAWLHYLAFMFMAGGAVAEMYLLKLPPSAEVVKTIARADRFYGIGAVLVLATGILRMPLAHGGKGIDHYLHSGAFHAALGLFALAALLSLLPTLRYLRWNREAAAGGLPTQADWAGLRKLVHLQMASMAIVALTMPLMARGV